MGNLCSCSVCENERTAIERARSAMSGSNCTGMYWRNKTTGQTYPFNCKSPRCSRSECRHSWSTKRRGVIEGVVIDYKLDKFFTLTLDPKQVDCPTAWDTISYIWSKMRKRLARLAVKQGLKLKFISVIEKQPSTGYPHIHGFTNVWLPSVINEKWEAMGYDKVEESWKGCWEAVGGGNHVWVKKLRNLDHACAYVAKYVTKEGMIETYSYIKKRARTMWRTTGLQCKGERDLTASKQGGIISEWEVVDNKGRTYGKANERQDLEGTQCPLPKGGVEQGEFVMEASTTTCFGSQEDKGLAREARQSKRRDQETQELIVWLGFGKLPEPSKAINNMIRDNVWLNAEQANRYHRLTV